MTREVIIAGLEFTTGDIATLWTFTKALGHKKKNPMLFMDKNRGQILVGFVREGVGEPLFQEFIDANLPAYCLRDLLAVIVRRPELILGVNLDPLISKLLSMIDLESLSEELRAEICATAQNLGCKEQVLGKLHPDPIALPQESEIPPKTNQQTWWKKLISGFGL